MSGGMSPGADPRVGASAPQESAQQVSQQRAQAAYGEAGPTEGVVSETGVIRHQDDVMARRDRVRWGPVWAGLVVTVASYLFLQLALIAVGIVDLADASITGDAIATAIVALIAFFLGGVTAGATALWRGSSDGLVHGAVMWATALVALLVLSGIGGGVALGSLDTTETFQGVTGTGQEVEVTFTSDDAQEAAAWSLLGLAVALAAALIGGAVGSSMWSPRDDDGRRIVMSRSAGSPTMRGQTQRERTAQY